jgi:hypothetical protein
MIKFDPQAEDLPSNTFNQRGIRMSIATLSLGLSIFVARFHRIVVILGMFTTFGQAVGVSHAADLQSPTAHRLQKHGQLVQKSEQQSQNSNCVAKRSWPEIEGLNQMGPALVINRFIRNEITVGKKLDSISCPPKDSLEAWVYDNQVVMTGDWSRLYGVLGFKVSIKFPRKNKASQANEKILEKCVLATLFQGDVVETHEVVLNTLLVQPGTEGKELLEQLTSVFPELIVSSPVTREKYQKALAGLEICAVDEGLKVTSKSNSKGLGRNLIIPVEKITLLGMRASNESDFKDVSVGGAISVQPKDFILKGDKSYRYFSPLVSGKNSEVVKKINNLLSHETSLPEVSMLGGNSIKNWIKEGQGYNHANYDILFNRKGILSLAWHLNSYGAGVVSDLAYLNVSTDSGLRLKAGDVFQLTPLLKTLGKRADESIENKFIELFSPHSGQKTGSCDANCVAEMKKFKGKWVVAEQFSADEVNDWKRNVFRCKKLFNPDQFFVSEKGVGFKVNDCFGRPDQTLNPGWNTFFTWDEIKPYIKNLGPLTI